MARQKWGLEDDFLIAHGHKLDSVWLNLGSVKPTDVKLKLGRSDGMGLQFMAHPSELTKKHWCFWGDIMGKKRKYYDMWGLSHYIIMILYLLLWDVCLKVGASKLIELIDDQPWSTMIHKSMCQGRDSGPAFGVSRLSSLSKIDPVSRSPESPESQKWFKES